MIGLLALTMAALFAGAAFYINFAEHPARMKLAPADALRQWLPAYKRGLIMQSGLAIAGFLLGLGAWLNGGSWLFLAGALAMIANWPFTLIVIMPINKRMEAMPPQRAAEAVPLLASWNRLHGARTALGAAAVVLFLAALSA